MPLCKLSVVDRSALTVIRNSTSSPGFCAISVTSPLGKLTPNRKRELSSPDNVPDNSPLTIIRTDSWLFEKGSVCCRPKMIREFSPIVSRLLSLISRDAVDRENVCTASFCTNLSPSCAVFHANDLPPRLCTRREILTISPAKSCEVLDAWVSILSSTFSASCVLPNQSSCRSPTKALPSGKYTPISTDRNAMKITTELPTRPISVSHTNTFRRRSLPESWLS